MTTTFTTLQSKIASLDTMSLKELRKLYAEVYGEATKCPNMPYLRRRLAEAYDALAERQETEAARAREAAEAAKALARAQSSEPEPEQTQPPAPAAAASPAVNPATGLPFDPFYDSDPTPAAIPAGQDGHRALQQALDRVFEKHVAAADEAPAPAEPPSPSHTEAPAEDQVRRRGRFAGMTIADLQALHLKLLGRATRSSSRPFLEWRCRRAEQAGGPSAPKAPRAAATSPVKVVPFRAEADLVARMDVAATRTGRSRNALIREAIDRLLAGLGNSEGAASARAV